MTAEYSRRSGLVNHYFKKVFVYFSLPEVDADQQVVLMKATKLLRSEFHFTGITIQVENCTS